MKTAFLNMRLTLPERVRVFREGFVRLGYTVELGVSMTPGPNDLLCTWNRIGSGDASAKAFEAAGRPVLVCENSSWGGNFCGGAWYHIARNQHNQAGRFPVGGHLRWDSLNVELHPWRTSGETVILPSRGFGNADQEIVRSMIRFCRARRMNGGRDVALHQRGSDMALAGFVGRRNKKTTIRKHNLI
jgi:hypothetical protein